MKWSMQLTVSAFLSLVAQKKDDMGCAGTMWARIKKRYCRIDILLTEAIKNEIEQNMFHEMPTHRGASRLSYVHRKNDLQESRRSSWYKESKEVSANIQTKHPQSKCVRNPDRTKTQTDAGPRHMQGWCLG